MARLGSLSQRVASADARSCVVALRNFRSCVGLLAARAVPTVDDCKMDLSVGYWRASISKLLIKSLWVLFVLLKVSFHSCLCD